MATAPWITTNVVTPATAPDAGKSGIFVNTTKCLSTIDEASLARTYHNNQDAATFVVGTTAIAPLTIPAGTNLTVAAAGAQENDGAAFYSTIDTTNGRRYND